MTCEQCVEGLEFFCTSVAEVNSDTEVYFGFVMVKKVSSCKVLTVKKFEWCFLEFQYRCVLRHRL